MAAEMYARDDLQELDESSKLLLQMWRSQKVQEVRRGDMGSRKRESESGCERVLFGMVRVSR